MLTWRRPVGLVTVLVAAAAEDRGWVEMTNAKSIGWAIYAAGFAIWSFGYLSAGHAPLFDWEAATPWWISSFVPNLEAELGLALMFASMIPIYWRASVEAPVMRGAMTSPRWSARQVATASIAYAALPVFGAATRAWWGFLAWLFRS
jgi:hypothetical protein